MIFPSKCWFQKFKVVVFPSNFWKTIIIWHFYRAILNFAQECHYLKNKVGVVDFTKPNGLIVCKIYYSHFIIELSDLLAKLKKNHKIFTKNDPAWKKLLLWVKIIAILWICSVFPKGRLRVIIVSAWLMTQIWVNTTQNESSESVNFIEIRPVSANTSDCICIWYWTTTVFDTFHVKISSFFKRIHRSIVDPSSFRVLWFCRIF